MTRVATVVAVERVQNPAGPPSVAVATAAALDTLVVIGNGMAGHRLCRRLIELGARRRYRIVVFGEEPLPAYDRVHLTDVITGRRAHDLLLSPGSWYAEQGIDLRLDDPVIEIDRSRHTVRAASGVEVTYGSLVFATGSSPYVPPIEGARLPSVFTYRTVRDACAIRERAETARTAAVIGGGLLGLEAARALQRMGLELLIVEAAAAVMPTQLDQSAGKELERQIAALGIRVVTAAVTKRIEAAGPQRRVLFGDGTSATVDMVVVAAGVRPRSELAAGCGLVCARNGAIVVDDDLRTSDVDIRAIGECASHRSQSWGLVAPAYEMADVLADKLLGRASTLSTSAPPTRLKALGVEVATAGEPLERGQIIRFQSAGTYRRLRVQGGRLVGALGVGDWPEFSRIHDATRRRQRVWPWQLARFERGGKLWAGPRHPAASPWSSDDIVCNCLSVTRGQLAAACAGASATVALVVERTGASTVCGTCRPLVAELIGAPARVPARFAWGLFAGSVVAMTIALVVLLAAPVPFSASVQGSFNLDVLWRNGVIRQSTGFSLLALTLLAGLLTLRKRWHRIRFGGYSTWRTAHAAIAALTLVVLGVHTGMRLGDNSNLVLMISFATLNVVGAAAGGVTAPGDPGGSGLQSRARRVLLAAHVAAIWPLPLLIAWHVVAVYYF